MEEPTALLGHSVAEAGEGLCRIPTRGGAEELTQILLRDETGAALERPATLSEH